MNVLIVDDSSVFRTVLKAALREQPNIHIAGSAQNGEVALKILRETPIDWVILDMEMPVLDGLETLIEMQKENFGARVLIFASSSVDTYPRIRQCLELGAVDFVLKPDSNSASAVADSIQKIRDDLIPLLTCPSLKGVASEKRPFQKTAIEHFQASQAKPEVVQRKNFEAIVIASSTGGPVALERLFSGLQGNATLPIFIVLYPRP
ncbi:MAG: response regulator, partial [Proteobacteria bacterium]